MPDRLDPRAERGPITVAAYEATISPLNTDIPAEVHDREILSALEDQIPRLERDLTRLAWKSVGPGFVVEIERPRITGSVGLLIRLAVLYPVRVSASLVEAIRRFAGEVELELARALTGLPPGRTHVHAALVESSIAELSDAAEKKSSWDQAAPVLAAIGTGVGVLGFVTFVGGAIDWARFRAAGLPREEALSVTPTQDLIVVGASTIVPAIAWGLLGIALFTIARVVVGRGEQRVGHPAQSALATAQRDRIRAILLAVYVAAFEIIAFIVTLEDPSFEQFVVFIFLGLLMAGLVFSLALVTDRFVFLSGAILLSVSIFLSGVAYVRERSTSELRGAAVVRENARAVIGFFVAEGSSRVYLARIDLEPVIESNEIEEDSSRLVAFDEAQITDLAIGPANEPQEALAHARDLAAELCNLQVVSGPPREKPGRRLTKQQESEIRACWPAGPSPPGADE